MRSLFLFFISLLVPMLEVAAQSLPADTRAPDSLRRVAAAHPADTVGVRTRTRLLVYYMKRDTTQARRYGQQARQLATTLRDTLGLARVEYELGTLAAQRGQPMVSVTHHQTSARWFLAQRNLAWVGHNQRNIGARYGTMGLFPEAMRHLLLSLSRRTAAGDSAGMADSYAAIGQVHINMRNYPAAQLAYEEALRRWQRLGARPGMVDAINHLAIIYRDTRRYDLAEASLRQGFAFTNLDSTNILRMLVTLGVLYQKQERWAASLPPLLRAERIVRQDPATPKLRKADLLSLLGYSLVKNKQVARAAPYMREALALSREIKAPQEEIDALEGMAEVALASNDPAAAFRYERARALLQDSLHTVATARQTSELQVRYETVEKDARNKVLAAQLRSRELALQRRTTQLVAALLVAALLTGLGYLLYNRHRLRQQLEREQERQLLARQRMADVLEAEEKERQRIGSDLHDSIGQLLTAAQLNLRALGREMGPAAPDEQQVLLDNALETVEESFREVRGISHNLIPNALLKRGLAAAVREFLDKLPTADGLRAEVQVFGLDERVEPGMEGVLFRVVQELVQNTIKHAQATEMVLQLVQSDTDLTIVLEDNGVGFDPLALGEQAGIGMRNMQSRVAYLGGQIHFDSAPGRGTTVSLEVPLAAGTPASPAIS